MTPEERLQGFYIGLNALCEQYGCKIRMANQVTKTDTGVIIVEPEPRMDVALVDGWSFNDSSIEDNDN